MSFFITKSKNLEGFVVSFQRFIILTTPWRDTQRGAQSNGVFQSENNRIRLPTPVESPNEVPAEV